MNTSTLTKHQKAELFDVLLAGHLAIERGGVDAHYVALSAIGVVRMALPDQVSCRLLADGSSKTKRAGGVQPVVDRHRPITPSKL